MWTFLVKYLLILESWQSCTRIELNWKRIETLQSFDFLFFSDWIKLNIFKFLLCNHRFIFSITFFHKGFHILISIGWSFFLFFCWNRSWLYQFSRKLKSGDTVTILKKKTRLASDCNYVTNQRWAVQQTHDNCD